MSSDHVASFRGWIMEPLSGGTQSTNELARMYFFPGLETFLFGDGRYNDGDFYYMATDAGYMRNILFGGLPVLFLIVCYPFALARIARNWDFLGLIVPMALVLHIKGVFIMNNPAGHAAMALLALSMARMEGKNENNVLNYWVGGRGGGEASL